MKVISALAFVLVLNLLPETAYVYYLAALLALLGFAWLAGLSAMYALRRSFIALPFILAALALPFTMPGETLYRLPQLGLSVSLEGMQRFLAILLRSWLAVQAALLLIATTRFPDLLWSFQSLRVPPQLLSIASFMYRYLFMLADEGLRMMHARQARSPGPEPPSLLWRSRVTGDMVGSLFLRSWERAERVYAAMASRGYDGRTRPHRRFHLQPADWGTLALTLTGLTGALIMARAL